MKRWEDFVSIHSTCETEIEVLGCASGRVLRHFAVQRTKIQVIGCDINRLHPLFQDVVIAQKPKAPLGSSLRPMEGARLC